MVRSICLKCGHGKGEPLAFCTQCGFVPEDSHDKARSILLSDAHRTAAQLADAARDVRGGRILMFDANELRTVLARLERERDARWLGLRKSTWLIVGAALAAAGALAAGATILLRTG